MPFDPWSRIVSTGDYVGPWLLVKLTPESAPTIHNAIGATANSPRPVANPE